MAWTSRASADCLRFLCTPRRRECRKYRAPCLHGIDRHKCYLLKQRYDHFLGRNRWLRDCAHGQADPRNERSFSEEAEVRVFLSPVIIRKNSAGG
jgi:hypothetical protein